MKKIKEIRKVVSANGIAAGFVVEERVTEVKGDVPEGAELVADDTPLHDWKSPVTTTPKAKGGFGF